MDGVSLLIIRIFIFLCRLLLSVLMIWVDALVSVHEHKLNRHVSAYVFWNQRPKGPHIVHLSTMCHLFHRLARAAISCYSNRPKNTNLVEDVEIFLPIKFRCRSFSGFRREVENVLHNHMPVSPSCFSDQPEEHARGRGHWDLAFYQVSLNSVQRFQRRIRKCFSQSEPSAVILFFRPARKTQTL